VEPFGKGPPNEEDQSFPGLTRVETAVSVTVIEAKQLGESYNIRAFYPFIFTKYPPASCLCNPSKHMPGAATFVPTRGYSPGGFAICIYCHLH